jgi:hypothetical protein
MSHDHSVTDSTASEDRIDQVCDKFEADWRAGIQSPIKAMLGTIKEPNRSKLFHELVLIELEYRFKQGDIPSPLEYADSFPEYLDLINSVDFSAKAISSLSSFANGRPSAPEVNEYIGRYRITDLLGEGSFGRVYHAFDEELQRSVAVKVPRSRHFSRNSEGFLAEARAVARLDHPNIVPVLDVGRTDEGAVYVVSKYIEGTSLKVKIANARPDFRDSAELVENVALALYHANKKRLVHRDIKPANILIEGHEPYVADFGLAVNEDNLKHKVVGTPATFFRWELSYMNC